LGHVLSHSQIVVDFPNYILLSKLGIAQQEVLVGFSKALKENQGVNSSVKLVTKHVLLTAVVSAHT
jgi:hypothetical protein